MKNLEDPFKLFRALGFQGWTILYRIRDKKELEPLVKHNGYNFLDAELFKAISCLCDNPPILAGDNIKHNENFRCACVEENCPVMFYQGWYPTANEAAEKWNVFIKEQKERVEEIV